MTHSVVKIKDVCDFYRGLTYSKSDEVDFSGNAVLRATNIDLITNKLNLSEIRYINDAVNISQDKKVQVNDVLICTASGSKSHLGKVAFIEEPLDMAFGGFMGVLRAKPNINPKFLFAFLKSDIFLKYVFGLSDGANINNLKFSQFENLEFNLPSLSTQQKIVEKLDAILAEIDKVTTAAEANIKNAEALFQSYLTEVFRADKHIDELCNIGSFLKLEYGKGLDESDRKESGAYFAYGANGIKAKTNKFLFDKPSIIVGRKGSVGELSLVFDRFWPLDVTYYVTHDSDRTDLKYLYYGLMAQNLPKYAKGVKPGINRNDVYALQMRLPSLIEQKKIALKFADLSEKVNDLSAIYKNKIKSLSSIKKNILLQAFNGKLVKEQE